MQLVGVTDLLCESGVFHDVVAYLRDEGSLSVSVIRAARPFVVAALARDWNGPIIFLTAHIRRAYNTGEQLPVWIGTGEQARTVLSYMEPASQFYERVPWVESVIRSRVETLAALAVDEADEPKPIVVASARALMQRTIPVDQFRHASMVLKVGQRWAMDTLLAKLVQIGYEPTPVVVEPGTFSRRGGVVDIFPVVLASPLRLDFFGDEIDTLRLFDPSSQRSSAHIKQVLVTPARETLPVYSPQVAAHLSPWFVTLPPAQADMTTPGADAESLSAGMGFPYIEHYLPYMYARLGSLLSYAPEDALIVVEDVDVLREKIDDIDQRALEIRAEQIEAGLLPPDYPKPYLDWERIEAFLQSHTVLYLGPLGSVSEKEHDGGLPLAGRFEKLFGPGGRFGGQLRLVLADLRAKYSQGHAVVVVSQQAARLKDLWYEQESTTFIPTATEVLTPPEAKSLVFVNETMQEGWSLNIEGQPTHLLTDAEIFGWSRPEPRRRRSGKPRRPPESDYADWNEGDYVVHVDYGIGQFAGMQHRTVEGTEREYLVVQYEGTDMVYVPIHQADRLTKYVGVDGSPPRLNRIGKPAEWNRVRRRAQKAVWEEAKGLLELYVARAQASGHAFSPDAPWQHELEASFPYVETEDQLRSVWEVKADMEIAHPMDRLICGDVGYGKTEIALRAAFKAVMDGRQVAVLVPTTVLAQQHYETFTNRLEPFPVKVEMMSRFRTKSEQERLLPRLASGEIDIVIGTHRILSQDIALKNLGLVIIDEEQRFGVKQKEHFKKLRTRVDVLTLTATPIPRTLYMGLTGVRDISMIQTPPEERLPAITHVGKFDDKLVRQAILREIERGGQVFFVHNRVHTIDGVHDRLEQIMPEARIVVAHGQMPERILEKVMSAFAHGECDVLLSTAIVESGIDIPNANTLIVDRADWFGMAQLYQLRGRVGRSAQQAYAYFFHPAKITEEARERLATLAEHAHLGAGFQVAMRDLEIRGAGDILSTRQTGHVAAVGLHLYTQLLKQAIQELSGQAGDEPVPVATAGIVIDLPIPAYIPKDWIPEVALRLQIYRRIAGLTARESVSAMRDELRDRFGILPKAVAGLLYQIEVKLLAQHANATQVMARGQQVQIKLPYLGEINREALARNLGEKVGVSRPMVTLPYTPGDDTWQQRLLDVLAALAAGIQPD